MTLLKRRRSQIGLNSRGVYSPLGLCLELPLTVTAVMQMRVEENRLFLTLNIRFGSPQRTLVTGVAVNDACLRNAEAINQS